MNEQQHEKYAADAKAKLRGALGELADADTVDTAVTFPSAREAGDAPVAQDLLLSDVDVAASGDEPYPLPQPALEKRAAEVAATVATVRDEMSQRVANLGSDNVAHFLLNQDGAEVCGGCSQAFPCEKFRTEIEMNNLIRSSGEPPTVDEQKVQAVMALLHVDEERARQMVLAATPLDEL